MPLRDILVHIDATPHSAARLAMACTLARAHNAHLTGLHAIDIPLPSLVVGDAAGAGMAVAELYAQLQDQAEASAATLRAGFEEAARRDGLPATWRQAEGITPWVVAQHARYADLAILGQAPPDDPRNTEVIIRCLFDSGRPVLVLPFAGATTSLGRRVLVGWNGSREASRAVHDALPLLVRAERVSLLVVNPEASGEVAELPGADIAEHLARHDVKAELMQHSAPELGAGEVLLNAITDTSADMLVIGGYGHSRMRELILGGVTRTLLRSMTVPVLLSH